MGVAAWIMYGIKLFHVHSSSCDIPEGPKDIVHCVCCFLRCQVQWRVTAWRNKEMWSWVSEKLSSILIISSRKRVTGRKIKLVSWCYIVESQGLVRQHVLSMARDSVAKQEAINPREQAKWTAWDICNINHAAISSAQDMFCSPQQTEDPMLAGPEEKPHTERRQLVCWSICGETATKQGIAAQAS